MDFGKFIYGIDNLFKFLSLSGLLIVLFALLYPVEMRRQMDFDVIEIEKKQMALEKDLDFIKTKLETLKQDSADVIQQAQKCGEKKKLEESKGKLNTEYYKAEEERLVKQIKAGVNEIKEFCHKQSIKESDLFYLKKKVSVAHDYISKYKVYFWISIIIGGFLSIYGFFKWHRNQSMADEMQKTQLEIAKKELSKKQ